MTSDAVNPVDEAAFRSDLESTLRRTDQMITAHALLRDGFMRRAAALSFVIILGATIVSFLSVPSDSTRRLLELPEAQADALVALAGILILLCSIAELHFGWREKSTRHAEAANALARLKLLLGRELASESAITRAKYIELQQAYENINDLVAKIPERKFLQLKALHRRKVEMSKFLDGHPGSNIVLLRIKIFIRDNFLAWPKSKR